MANDPREGPTTTAGSASTPKEQFLRTYEDEHARTMRVLRAYPAEKSEMRPHDSCKSARELAWLFSLERGLGRMVLEDAFAAGGPSGEAPTAPERWEEVLRAVETSHREFVDYIRRYPDTALEETSKFFIGPKTVGDVRRMDFLWFLLHDEIHHRGQFSVYLRMAGGKVPSIYGPSGDEPWM